METLKTRHEFQRVQKGRKWVTAAFVLHGKERDHDSSFSVPRFGFTVSSKSVVAGKAGDGKRVRGKAVDRNRARRRLKEAVRLSANAAARSDFDYVIIGRIAALTRNFDVLLADMTFALHKVSQMAR